MPNFYTEHPELKFHLNNPMMERICELKERGYRDKEQYDYAPQDYADALDSYDKVLEITGEITGEVIAANAEGVDQEGPHHANGRVEYASGTKQYPIHHVRRNRGTSRCRIRKHLVIAGLYRNPV